MKCNNLKPGRVSTHYGRSKAVLVELIGIEFVELWWFSLAALAWLTCQPALWSISPYFSSEHNADTRASINVIIALVRDFHERHELNE
jgi:hypothetical protein